jgi:hypothetical protein
VVKKAVVTKVPEPRCMMVKQLLGVKPKRDAADVSIGEYMPFFHSRWPGIVIVTWNGSGKAPGFGEGGGVGYQVLFHFLVLPCRNRRILFLSRFTPACKKTPYRFTASALRKKRKFSCNS